MTSNKFNGLRHPAWNGLVADEAEGHLCGSREFNGLPGFGRPTDDIVVIETVAGPT
jgi:hypothetical protein